MIREFPYTNLHDLNIDWILKVIKDFHERYGEFGEYVENLIAQIQADYEGFNALYTEKSEALMQEALAYLSDMHTALTNAISQISAQSTSAQAEIEALVTRSTESLEFLKQQIISSGALAVQYIYSAEQDSLGEILGHKQTAVNDINNAKSTALTDISTAESNAIADIQATIPDLPNTYVSAKQTQSFTSAEKQLACTNIGAAVISNTDLDGGSYGWTISGVIN